MRSHAQVEEALAAAEGTARREMARAAEAPLAAAAARQTAGRAAASAAAAWGAARGATREGEGVPAAVRAEQPRLVFYSGPHKLPPSATVFQGIQQLAQAGLGPPGEEVR